MIRAKVTLSDGKPLYLFGLSARNLELLQQGKPIHIDLSELGGVGEICIMFGQTEEAIRDDLADLIGPSTVIKGHLVGH